MGFGFDLGSNQSVDLNDGRGPVYSDDELAEAAFHHFWGSSFPYPNKPIHTCMQEINRLAKMPSESLLTSTVGYQVADTYHPYRFSIPVIDKSSTPVKTPVKSWGIEKNLRKAIKMELKHSGSIGERFPNFIKLVNGTQSCSNFRPGFSLYLYREFCNPGDVVLDTSTGFGGRLIGFAASECSLYIGIDPNTKTHNGNNRMAKDLKFSDRVELYNLPAEDLPHSKVVERCQFAFTSPPYFCKEQYSNELTQSWKRYTTGKSWRIGFLIPMMRLQFAALKSGGISCLNIADVKIKSKIYPLEKWTLEAGKRAGFKFVEKRNYALKYRMRGKYIAREPVLVFRKPIG